MAEATEILKPADRPRVEFNNELQIVTVYCTPELFRVFQNMTQDRGGNAATDLIVMLKAMKQVKQVLLKQSNQT